MANQILTTSHGTNREAFSPRDWGLFLSISAIWGSSFLWMAIGLDAFHPGLVTWLRIGFGAAFMAALPQARKASIPRFERRRIAVLGLIWLAIPFVIFPIAQQWIDSSVTGMLNGATPIFTALVASILLWQLPGRLQIIGLVVGFTGILAIALPSAGESTSAAIGVVLVVLATVCYAFATNMVAPLQQKYGSLAVMARVQWVALALVTPYGIYGLTQSHFAWPSLAAMAVVGVIGTGFALVLMGSLVGSVGPTRASFVTYVYPVVALVLGVVFRDELVSPIAIFGIGLVIIGALLASRSEVSLRPLPAEAP